MAAKKKTTSPKKRTAKAGAVKVDTKGGADQKTERVIVRNTQPSRKPEVKGPIQAMLTTFGSQAMKDAMENKIDRYEVELHSKDPRAIEATVQTIKELGGVLHYANGKHYLRGASRPLDFIAWAAERQGYVKRVVRGT